MEIERFLWITAIEVTNEYLRIFNSGRFGVMAVIHNVLTKINSCIIDLYQN